MTIPFKRLHPAAIPPARAHPGDAGADLYSLNDPATFDYRALMPGERRLYKTGVALAIPHGHYGRIVDRSGRALKEGLHVLGGTIDHGYSGDVGVILLNTSRDPIWVQPNERIAQLIVQKCELAEFAESEDLEQSARGAGGFGSTGTA